MTGIGVALSIIRRCQCFTFGRNQARLASFVFVHVRLFLSSSRQHTTSRGRQVGATSSDERVGQAAMVALQRGDEALRIGDIVAARRFYEHRPTLPK